MTNRLISFLLMAATLVAVFSISDTAQADEPDDEPDNESFDMNTDNDRNNIPDEFENAYREIRTIAEAGQDVTNTMNEFIRRIPVSSQTLSAKADIASMYQQLQSASSVEQQQVLLIEIQNIADRMVRDDPVHAAALQYLDMLDPYSLSELDGVGSVSGASSGFTAQRYEDKIKRRGDVMFVHYRRANPAWTWAKSWSHVGMYDGQHMVYDSDIYGCNGVDRRRISKFISNGNKLQYAQLANSSGRSSVGSALSRAISKYGTECTTPYNFNFLNKTTESKMYCSQLVWKTYLDIGDYSVDLDSNNWSYLLWLHARYSSILGVIPTVFALKAVAPDEIARDSDLDYYFYENTVRIVEP